MMNDTGIVYLIGAGPGDPGLLTLRGKECLERAQVVVYDRLANRALLRHAPQAQWINVGKQPDHHPTPQEQINALLVTHARAGKVVARLKGGDPFVFGRGGEEALALAEAGLPFEVVPGVTSAIAVPAYAGIPVSQRNMACSFVVIAGHRSEGAEDGCLEDSIIKAALGADTKIFLMGVHNLPTIVDRLQEGGCQADLPVAVIAQGTLPGQQVVVGTLGDIVPRAANIRPPAIIVVGEVAGLYNHLRWFDPAHRRPLLGLRVLNTRASDTRTRQSFSDRLAALGAQVLDLPTTRFAPPSDREPLDMAIQRLGKRAYDWIVFSSATAVQFFFERLYLQGYDARRLAGARLGAVGRATAEALWEHHLLADFVPTRFTGQDWAAQAPNLNGRRVLLPRSEIAPDELVLALQQRKAQVESVPAYTILPAEPQGEVLQCLFDGQVDVITLFSPSALHGLLEMLRLAGEPGQDVAALLNRCTLACIGPSTAQAADRLGLHVDVVPHEHTVDGLVEALVKWRVPS